MQSMHLLRMMHIWYILVWCEDIVSNDFFPYVKPIQHWNTQQTMWFTWPFEVCINRRPPEQVGYWCMYSTVRWIKSISMISYCLVCWGFSHKRIHSFKLWHFLSISSCSILKVVCCSNASRPIVLHHMANNENMLWWITTHKKLVTYSLWKYHSNQSCCFPILKACSLIVVIMKNASPKKGPWYAFKKLGHLGANYKKILHTSDICSSRSIYNRACSWNAEWIQTLWSFV